MTPKEKAVVPLPNDDNRPVLIVKDGKYLVHAGDPANFSKKLLGEYAQAGYAIKTITIKEFRGTVWTWVYDKSKTKTR